MRTRSVLVVDDERSQREILKTILAGEGYDVEAASGGRQALTLARAQQVDVLLSDLKMSDMDGIAVLDEFLRINPAGCVIIMTAHGSIGSAVEAMKKGAFDYLIKPLERDELLIVVERAFERLLLADENRLLREQLRDRHRLDNIIGTDGKMQEIFRFIRKIAPSNATVLIYGESGTGKELVAQAIHFHSPRRQHTFHAVNCAALPETLLETELFGHERGAFTGAESRKLGLFEIADGSTLLLDEIGDMSLATQAKILRVLQEREIVRVGGGDRIKVDVRIIAATNQDLERLLKAGRFREDLYYRLNVLPVTLPPLRARPTDIPLLAEHFVAKYARLGGKHVTGLTAEALEALQRYGWPGNVRQLEATLERAVLLTERQTITIDDIPIETRPAARHELTLDFELPDGGIVFEELERTLIERALEKANGVAARAAELLGMSYKTFIYRAEKFQVRRVPAPVTER